MMYYKAHLLALFYHYGIVLVITLNDWFETIDAGF
jgi:hypothetical protein